jgi:hypothetical protein
MVDAELTVCDILELRNTAAGGLLRNSKEMEGRQEPL